MNRRQKAKKKKKTAEETPPPPPPNEPKNAHSGGEDFLLPPPRDFSAIQLAHRSVRLPSLFIALSLSLSLTLHVRVVYELCTTTTATTTSSRNTNSILDFVLIVVHNSSFFTAGESDLSQPPSSAQAVIRLISSSGFCSFSYSVIHSLPCVVLSVLLTHSLSFCSITTDFRCWPLFCCCCCDCGANLMCYSVRVLSSSSQATEAISSTTTWIVTSASHTYTHLIAVLSISRPSFICP